MTLSRITLVCALLAAAPVAGCGGGQAPSGDGVPRDLRVRVADATVAVVGRVGERVVRQTGTVVDARQNLVVTTAHSLWGARSLKLDTTLGTLHGRVVALAPCHDLALLETYPKLPGLGALEVTAAREALPGDLLEVFGFHWTAPPGPAKQLRVEEVRKVRSGSDVRVGPGLPILRAAMVYDGAPPVDLTGGPVIDVQGRMVGLATMGPRARNAAVDGATINALLGSLEHGDGAAHGGWDDAPRCHRQLDDWAAARRAGFVAADAKLGPPLDRTQHDDAAPAGDDANRDRGMTVRRLPAGEVPTDVAVAGGTVWVTTAGNDRLIALDARTGELRSGSSPTGANPLRVAATHAAVWTVNAEDRTLTRVDPRLPGDRGAKQVKGVDALDVAVAPDAIWVTNGSAGTVTRLDPVSGAVRGSVAAGRYPTAVALGRRDVWVIDSGKGTVVRIERRENRVVSKPVQAGRDPQDVVVADGSVWVANRGDGTVSRLSERTGHAVGRPIRVGGAPTALAAANGRVFVVDAVGARLISIDARSGRPGRVLAVGGFPGAVAASGGVVWITDARNADVLRLRG
ncbi:MAG: extracellular solute-binding protein [Frankiales bacterium]|nr:extracellular solute-binding protein [Frankiales bacterium]